MSFSAPWLGSARRSAGAVSSKARSRLAAWLRDFSAARRVARSCRGALGDTGSAETSRGPSRSRPPESGEPGAVAAGALDAPHPIGVQLLSPVQEIPRPGFTGGNTSLVDPTPEIVERERDVHVLVGVDAEAVPTAWTTVLVPVIVVLPTSG